MRPLLESSTEVILRQLSAIIEKRMINVAICARAAAAASAVNNRATVATRGSLLYNAEFRRVINKLS